MPFDMFVLLVRLVSSFFFLEHVAFFAFLFPLCEFGWMDGLDVCFHG